jgi:hypothetical protein
VESKKEKRNKILIEWAATILTIAGAILNVFLVKEGFYIWGISNILWVFFGIKYKHLGLALTFFVLLIINIVGIIYWN